MICGELDIPDEILAARDAGELLVFAGAGVSMGGTARYPDFCGLVRRIGKNTGRAWQRGENFDHYLGALENDCIDVHRAAKQLLTDPKSSPNPLHRDILRLFKDAGNVRIVTTNLDNHFTTAATQFFGAIIPTYVAPALPVGGRFYGIVYVHGSATGSADELVLTDRDFGKAYSTEGWARLFLLEALKRYTVLFVGYSHNDPPMVYLTRGVTPEAKRSYAFTRAADVSHWQHLRITPIIYPTRKNEDHGALAEAVHIWSEHASMRTLDHKERIKGLLSKSPKDLNGAEASYLLLCFRAEHLIGMFFDYGMKPCWLAWAEDAKLLTPAFAPATGQDQRHAMQVARWFAQHAVTNPREALAVYMRAKLAMPAHLWNHIGWRYHSARDGNQQGRAVWMAQLCMHWAPAYSTNWLEYAMTKSAENNDFQTALMILEFLSTPRVIHERSFSSLSNSEAIETTSSRVTLTVNGNGSCIADLWQKHLKDRLGEYSARLAEMASSKLATAYELQVVHAASDPDGKKETFDHINFTRSAIEPNEQNNYFSAFDVLIDIARESFESLLKANRSLAVAVRTRWTIARSPLLVRLAIHGIRIDPRMSPDHKLLWVVKNRILTQISHHHEVFLVVREVFASCTRRTQQAFLAYLRCDTLQCIELYGQKDPTSFWHGEFSWLAMLNEATAHRCSAVRARLASIVRKYPRFRQSDHPEFTHYSSSGWTGRRSPKATRQLRSMPARKLMPLLITYKGRGWWRGPSRVGLMETVREAAQQDPRWGLSVAERLVRINHAPQDVWAAIVGGWTQAKLDVADWQRIVEILSQLPVLSGCARETLNLLQQGAGNENTGIPQSHMVVAERTALLLFRRARKTDTADDLQTGWLTAAINRVGGVSCQFLLHALARKRRLAGRKWQRIPERYQKILDTMVSGRTVADQYGRTVLASQLPLLYSLDSKWTKTNLLPLFDWDRDEVAATQAWQGFLTWGSLPRACQPLMRLYYTQAAGHLDRELKHVGSRLIQAIAALTMHLESPRYAEPMLTAFFRAASIDQRVEFAHAVRHLLSQMPTDLRHRVWTTRVRPYWADRNLGKPVPLHPKELVPMMSWPPILGADFESAVELLEACACLAPGEMSVLHDFAAHEVVQKQPAVAARFLLAILQKQSEDFVYVSAVQEIAGKLVQHPPAFPILAQLVEVLARKGYIVEAEAIQTALAGKEGGKAAV